MADLTTDFFNESKDRVKVLFQRGRDLADAELNELQDLERVLRRRTLRSIFGDGFISTGYQITESANPNEIIISEGDALIQGEHLNNPSSYPVQDLTTPVADRVDIVYLKVREIEVDSVTDPDMLLPDIGETARRVVLEQEVIVDEGSTTLPTTTGDIHAAGIHYELIGYLYRLAGNPLITSAMIVDSRRIIGFVFLNEDKNLEIIGGGDVSYDDSNGSVSFTEPIRIIQPSTLGHALIQLTQSPFLLPDPGDTAYIILNRSALVDYDVSVIITDWNSVPNNANAFPLFYRGTDDKLYAVEGTVWAGVQTHPMRVNPFTGLIVDADVAPGANIDGDKLAVGSVPLDRLESQPVGVPLNGVILWGESGTCPSGFTKLELGLNDTYIRVAGTGGVPDLTPAGANTHGHGAHTHSDGSYAVNLPLFDLFNVAFGGAGNFDAFQSGVGSGIRTQAFSVSGTSGSTTISTVSHEPKHVQFVLCKKA